MAYPNYNQFIPNYQMQAPAPAPTPQVPQLFPQPQGSVYSINNTLEVANIPAGAGVNVAICLSENLIYLKSIQNGQPIFWAYRIEPYEEKTPQTQSDERLSQLEEKLDKLIKELKE